jgi:hypothetical protein
LERSGGPWRRRARRPGRGPACEAESAWVPWRRRAGSRRGSLDSRRAAARLSGGGAGALEMTGRRRCCGSSGQREAGQFGATGGGVPLLQAELWPPRRCAVLVPRPWVTLPTGQADGRAPDL